MGQGHGDNGTHVYDTEQLIVSTLNGHEERAKINKNMWHNATDMSAFVTTHRQLPVFVVATQDIFRTPNTWEARIRSFSSDKIG